MVPADSARISRVPAYSGAVSLTLGFSLTGLSPSAARLSSRFCSPAKRLLLAVLQPRPCRDRGGLGYCAFARHYLRNHCCFLFLRVLRCFSSPGSPCAQHSAGIASGGLPHSEIRVSMSICLFTRLIAACHVLLRLREPRHPSCALLSFPLTFRRTYPILPGLCRSRVPLYRDSREIRSLLCRFLSYIISHLSMKYARSFASNMSMCDPLFRSPWQS